MQRIDFIEEVTYISIKNRAYYRKIILEIITSIGILGNLLAFTTFAFNLSIEFAYVVGAMPCYSIMLVIWYILTIEPKPVKYENVITQRKEQLSLLNTAIMNKI
jgi:hypothetical protein